MAGVAGAPVPDVVTSGESEEVSRLQSRTKEQPMMYLTLLEETFPTPAPAIEMSEIWAELPETVLENVLLFLPTVIQARFCTVCKLWWKLIMSSRFRDQTAMIALRSGKSMAVCSALEAFHTGERLKVAKMKLPTDVEEADLKPDTNWCAQSGLLALNVCDCESGGMRIFVFNPVEETPCQELPRLPWNDNVGGDLAIVVDGDNSFRVVLSYLTPQDHGEESFYGFYICSSSANGMPPMTWSRVAILRSSIDQVALDMGDLALGGLRLYSYFLSRRFIYALMRHRGLATTQLYVLVRLGAKAEYISIVPPVSPSVSWRDVYFVPSYPSETLFAVLPDRTIFKLDDGSTVWKLVFSPPEELKDCSRVADVGFVGDTLLMLVFHKEMKAEVMAYDTVSDLWTRGCQTNNSPADSYPKFIAPRCASLHG